jgi:hypothetical protein
VLKPWEGPRFVCDALVFWMQDPGTVLTAKSLPTWGGGGGYEWKFLFISPRNDLNKNTHYCDRIFSSNKFWEELTAYLLLIRHRPHRKRFVQQLFYCCMCIRCRGNFSTEPLPSNAVEMGSGTAFHKDKAQAINSWWRRLTDTQTTWRSFSKQGKWAKIDFKMGRNLGQFVNLLQNNSQDNIPQYHYYTVCRIVFALTTVLHLKNKKFYKNWARK